MQPSTKFFGQPLASLTSSGHLVTLLLFSELADFVLLVLRRVQLGEPVLQLAPPLLLDCRLSDGVELQQAVGLGRWFETRFVYTESE